MNKIFITGTDTDVGKTWVSCKLLQELTSLSIPTIPFKPVTSGVNPNNINHSDGYKLASAAGLAEKLSLIAPYTFKKAISPVSAAHTENKVITTKMVEASYTKLLKSHIKTFDLALIEGAGGFYSPMLEGCLNADIAKAMGCSIILVVEDRVGCINHTLLTIEAIKNTDLNLIAIMLNNKNRLTEAESSYIELQKCIQPIKVTQSIEDLAHIVVKEFITK